MKLREVLQYDDEITNTAKQLQQAFKELSNFYKYLNQDVIKASEIQLSTENLFQLRENINIALNHLFEVNMQSDKVRILE